MEIVPDDVDDLRHPRIPLELCKMVEETSDAGGETLERQTTGTLGTPAVRRLELGL